MVKSLTGSGIVAGRILREFAHNRRTLLFWTMFPTLMLLLFGTVYAPRFGGMDQSFTYTAPGILIGAALFFSCLAGPLTVIVGERERNTLKRLLISPLSGTAYFLGVLWAHVAVALVQAGIIYGLTLSVGGRFHGSLWLGVLIILLSVAAYAGIGITCGAFLARRTEDATGPVAAVGVPLLVLGGTFFPVDGLSPSLFRIAQFDPVFHMNEAMRATWTHGASLSEQADTMLLLALLALVSITLGASSYSVMLRREAVS